MKKNTLRSLSLLLAVVLVFAGLPFAAFADVLPDQPLENDGYDLTVSVFGVEQENYEPQIVDANTGIVLVEGEDYVLTEDGTINNILINEEGNYTVKVLDTNVALRTVIENNQMVYYVTEQTGDVNVTVEEGVGFEVAKDAVTIPVRGTLQNLPVTVDLTTATVNHNEATFTAAGTYKVTHNDKTVTVVISENGVANPAVVDFGFSDLFTVNITTKVNGVKQYATIEVDGEDWATTSEGNNPIKFYPVLGQEYDFQAYIVDGGVRYESEVVEDVVVTAESNSVNIELNITREAIPVPDNTVFTVSRWDEAGNAYDGLVEFYAVRGYADDQYSERHEIMPNLLGTFTSVDGKVELEQADIDTLVANAKAVAGASEKIFAIRAGGLQGNESTSTSFVTINVDTKGHVVVYDKAPQGFKVKNYIITKTQAPKDGNEEGMTNLRGQWYTIEAVEGVEVNVHGNTSAGFQGMRQTFTEEPIETKTSGVDGIAYIDNSFTPVIVNTGLGVDDYTVIQAANQLRVELDGYSVFAAKGEDEDPEDPFAQTNPYVITGYDLQDERQQVEFFWLADEEAEDIVDRISGSTRFETAVELAKRLEARLATKYNHVIIANGYTFADALVANGLAQVLNAPILLTYRDELPQVVAEYIQNHGGIKKATIMGGTLAVSADVEGELEDLGLITDRISGPDRYATSADALEVLMKLRGVDGVNAFLVNGTRPYDALVASVPAAAYAEPILLTETNNLPASVASVISENVKYVTVVGGTSVVSNEVYQAIPRAEKQRLYGADRNTTAMKVAERFFADATKAYIVRDNDFADALVAARLAAANNGVILLTDPNVVSAELAAYIKGSKISDITIVGGTLAVSEAVREQLEEVILSK